MRHSILDEGNIWQAGSFRLTAASVSALISTLTDRAEYLILTFFYRSLVAFSLCRMVSADFMPASTRRASQEKSAEKCVSTFHAKKAIRHTLV
jgi:hypothetical protein